MSFVCGYARDVITLRDGWKFENGEQINAQQINFDDSRWQHVTIPHDWAIAGPFIPDGDGNTGKLPWRDEGWYRMKFDANESWTGKTIYVLCDGIMAFPKVYVNGKLAGTWDYGYNSFYLDITPFLHSGSENLIAVHADTRQHDSRWYPGAGIYRKVQLIIVDPVHVDVWGTYITTPIVKSHAADVRIRSTIQNKTSFQQKIIVENVIISPNGSEIARETKLDSLDANSSRCVEMTITLTNPQRWELEHPVLYQLKTNILMNNNVVDTYITPFGVRTMRFTADDGFYLNDKRVQFKGVNLHHDHGPLGAAFYPRAMERQLDIMIAMGCNAIRTSHNVAAPELLDMCDRKGLLVFDEIFDKYDNKADITNSTDFEEFAHRNVRNFVVRDRNHPSIFIWSVGNEIGDVQWNQNNGFQRLHTMVNYVRKYDHTRPVTLVCDRYESAKLRHFDYYDVHSWNYGRRYLLARQLEPNKSVIISESGSTVSTRGFYELPLPEKKTDFTKSMYVSSYDLNAPVWADLPDDDFMWQQDENYIAGEFVWTGFDYLGEPTPYSSWSLRHMGMDSKDASRSSYFGIVDLCGIPKDRYYLYKSYWKQDETTIHILPHWNWPDKVDEKIPVFVYTNGDCVELFLNGKSLGKKCKNPRSEISTERFRLRWDEVVYKPGELKAVAYKEGQLIGEQFIRTADAPHSIRLTPDRTRLQSDGMDLSYILIEAFDKTGNPCPLAENTIGLKVDGPAEIAGVGNGDQRSYAPFQATRVKLFYGKAMLIVKTGIKPGDVRITASAKALGTAQTTLTIVK
ncbi:DUF4982 domain-containing protein [candidate division KSB1 bacterium]|nr:DUF4982 domain-containing protein [candidate division KSB1 bacterium]